MPDMKVKRPPKRLIIQPPLIPVIDIVFNLLIFFMLTPSVTAGDGFVTTNLPKSSGPVPGKAQLTEVRLKVLLQETGPKNQYLDNAKNDYCDIIVEGEDLGSNFDALLTNMKSRRDHGLSAHTAILITPTMGCLHKWVVRGFDSIVAAGFDNIQFAVPYE
jgi:biopolymer transport protein ExbD